MNKSDKTLLKIREYINICRINDKDVSFQTLKKTIIKYGDERVKENIEDRMIKIVGESLR